jgi:hypothetical protein
MVKLVQEDIENSLCLYIMDFIENLIHEPNVTPLMKLRSMYMP